MLSSTNVDKNSIMTAVLKVVCLFIFLFQTCINFFLLLNTKYILKNSCWSPLTPPHYASQWGPGILIFKETRISLELTSNSDCITEQCGCVQNVQAERVLDLP